MPFLVWLSSRDPKSKVIKRSRLESAGNDVYVRLAFSVVGKKLPKEVPTQMVVKFMVMNPMVFIRIKNDLTKINLGLLFQEISNRTH